MKFEIIGYAKVVDPMGNSWHRKLTGEQLKSYFYTSCGVLASYLLEFYECKVMWQPTKYIVFMSRQTSH